MAKQIKYGDDARKALEKGVNTLYLLTEHTSFYERCGWEYFCTALPDGESEPLRVYMHKQTK